MISTACAQPANRRLRQLAAAVLLMLYGTAPATAEESAPLKIDSSGPVIYCDIGPVAERDQFVRILKEGTPLTLSWELTVERVRNYLPDKEIGTVELTRQALPDLVSRYWRISDSNSGISRKVGSAAEAADFLSTIHHFPVIDRSLLKKGESYLIIVKMHVAEGTPSDAWWEKLLRFGKTVATGELRLP